MEFNVNASQAGARLRTGVGTHTLSIGDHDVTLMISGSRVELMTLAITIAAEAGLKISVDGFVDGTAVFEEITAVLNGDEDLIKFSFGNALKQLNTQRAEIERLRARLGDPA